MYPWSLRHILVVAALWLIIISCGCRHTPVVKKLEIAKQPVFLTQRNVNLTFVPEQQKTPPYVLFKKVDHFYFAKSFRTSPYKVEIITNPTMRNPSMTAKVIKKGKVVREFEAKRTQSSMISDNTTLWSPARSKLVLTIPFIEENEELAVTTSYEWMDTRWLPPILLTEQGLTEEGVLTVDVPYGITMHFKATKDKENFEFLPDSQNFETSLWAQEDNRSGLGMRHVWRLSAHTRTNNDLESDQPHLFLSFETPNQNPSPNKFDSWQAVADYINNRVDRYDVPSTAISEFVAKETRDLLDDEQKVDRILTLLSGVQKRSVLGNYQDQEVQPATRTFARNAGSSFDIAILGKAMLSSTNITSNIVVIGDKRYNPHLVDFYSPALFRSVVLQIILPHKTIYFDPESPILYHVSPSLQGQHALMLRQKNALFFTMPYDGPDENTQAFSYQLWMNDLGSIEGQFSNDLRGAFTEGLKGLDIEKLRLEGTSGFERQINRVDDPAFPWATIDVDQDPAGQKAHIFGDVKPKFLTKNDQGNFELKLAKIIEPIMQSLTKPESEGLSHTIKLSFFLSLPSGFEIVEMPPNLYLDMNGIEGRLYVSYSDGKLVVEGNSRISLPVSKNALENLNDKILELNAWREQTIIIQDLSHGGGIFDGEEGTREEKTP